MNVHSKIFPTFLYVSKYWHHGWHFLSSPVSQSSGLAIWENDSWSPLAGVCVCVCVCMCVFACICPCMCASCAWVWLSVHMDCVRSLVDLASCFPRGLQMQSEPLLWPGLCKFFPLGGLPLPLLWPLRSYCSLWPWKWPPLCFLVHYLLFSGSEGHISFSICGE